MTKEIPGVFHNEPEMTSEDLDQIEILTESECAEKWNDYVSAVSRHFMLMTNDEWPAKITTAEACWYHWIEDWNNNHITIFRERLQGIGIPSNSPIFIFWMKETGIKTTWGVFCDNWINFLYEDEGCILVVPNQEVSVILSNGFAWLGTRSTPRAI